MNDISSKTSPNGCSAIHYLSDRKPGGLNNLSPVPSRPSPSSSHYDDPYNPARGIMAALILVTPFWALVWWWLTRE